MTDRAYIVSRTLEHKIAIAENNDQNALIVTLDVLKEILALLKEQEAVKPVRDKKTGRVWLCGNCGSYVGFEDNDPHDPNEFDKYCRECGRPVLWERPDMEKIIEILEKAKTIIEKWVPMFEQYNTPAGIDDAIAMMNEQKETIKQKDKEIEDLIEAYNFEH